MELMQKELEKKNECEKTAQQIQIKKKNYQCKECGQNFSTSYNLSRHKHVYGVDKSSCSVCGKNFSRADSLYRHMKQHRIFICQ